MRLTREQVEVISYRIVGELRRAGLISVDDAADVEARVRQHLVDDLVAEDELNEEVRRIMRQHNERIRRADVQFHEMFRAIKARLAEERGLIL
ncbi:MAG: DUF507 family protein [Acidobacteriota bacterium]